MNTPKTDENPQPPLADAAGSEILKRCDVCGQTVMVNPRLTQHGRFRYGTTEILPCGTLIPVPPNDKLSHGPAKNQDHEQRNPTPDNH